MGGENKMKWIRHDSVKWKMVSIFLLCWFLPFILLIGVIAYYIVSNQTSTLAENTLSQLKFNNQICMERLNHVMAVSREATRDKVIEEAYNQYVIKERRYQSFYAHCNLYMKEQYQNDESFMNAIFWNEDLGQKIHSEVYNPKAGGAYQQIIKYWKEDHEKIKDYANTLDTKMGFYYTNGRLYMVRNMVNTNYHVIGTIVMRLNLEYCFNPFYTVDMGDSILVKIDHLPIEIQKKDKGIDPDDLKGKQTGYEWGEKFRVYDTIDGENCILSTMVEMEKSSLMTPFYGYQYVIIGMILFLIPLLFILLRTFRYHVSMPIEKLMQGAEWIENGNLGQQLAYQSKDIEFQYLVNAMNQMSKKLKYQFDHIYEEELALKDAKIMALQAHINPHFMNNTLEIINWEARMGDNAKVSKMIEALSILMDAAMDRKKNPEVMLSEELMYVESYLYIVKERFGKRLQIIKELDDNLREYFVPRLILQPVIENAVEHGAATHGNGKVVIRSREDQDYLYLEIENDGTLEPSDVSKIKRLLAPDYDTSKESSGNLGIANVNQRLRILYGEECGLTMESTEAGVCSILKIAKRKGVIKEKMDLKNQIWQIDQ